MKIWIAILLAAVAAPTAASQHDPGGFWGMPLMEHARPGAGTGPTVVHIALFVVDIKRLDDVGQTAAVDFLLRYEWDDPRLALVVSRNSSDKPKSGC